jgi:DNA polymerase-3 subunit epsilon
MNQILTFFDTETTGLSADNGDKIVEIGAIQMINGVLIEDKIFHFYINPERSIPFESTRIHGITDEKVKDAPKFREIAHKFLEFIKNTTLVAHNAQFDIKFLNKELSFLNLGPLDHPIQDTLKIAKTKFPGASASLDALCKRFEISLRERTFHGALLDSKLLACVYRKMVLNNQSSLDFYKKLNKDLSSRVITPIREHLCAINDNEKSKHLEFSKKFGFWNNGS